ncbi:MAG TPA: aminoglycoside phosphotransferase family protein [Alphaproteobacteria bacterium]|nr:aminoglycoside phosphotransferase family protein [Alphaproteobacteria bacterium]
MSRLLGQGEGQTIEVAPTKQDAASIAECALGRGVVRVERFTTGSHHFVYDITLEDGEHVVARLSWPSQVEAAQGSVRWSRALRPIGVPLPKLICADTSKRDVPFPYVLFERLPGRDLADEFDNMTREERRVLAFELAEIQAKVRTLPEGRGFGYAFTGDPPLKDWQSGVYAGIERSRERIREVGYFEESWADRVERAARKFEGYFARIRPVPFLHDITTKNVLIESGKLTGIVDVDSICYGDIVSLIALIRMALIAHGKDARYAEDWVDALALTEEQRGALSVYVAECCLDFMSEIGQRFNRDQAPQIDENYAAHLQSVLEQTLSEI